jgi:hypothetical protein
LLAAMAMVMVLALSLLEMVLVLALALVLVLVLVLVMVLVGVDAALALAKAKVMTEAQWHSRARLSARSGSGRVAWLELTSSPSLECLQASLPPPQFTIAFSGKALTRRGEARSSSLASTRGV